MSAQPADWSPDPSNPLQERLWDGTEWLERVRPRPPAITTSSTGRALPSANPLMYVPPSPAAPTGKLNGLALASMIISLVPFLLPLICAIVAVVLGHVAQSQLRKNPTMRGKGFAITGVTLGWFEIAVYLLVLVSME
jgi:hypothetical protein